MKCSTIIYINAADPRIFVYKHAQHKWVGVTLNFAHVKSYTVLGLTLLPMLVLALLLQLNIIILTTPWLLISFLILYFVYICVYCFYGAAKDLAKFPGPLAKR